MDIAIFGGSFDPPHIGHYKIVKKIFNKLKVDKVVVVPTYLNRFKSSFFLAPKTRFLLLKKLFSHLDILISNFEIRQKRPTPSYKTVLFLKKELKAKKIFFVVGADNVDSLKFWYNYKRLTKLVEFVVVTRDDIVFDKGFKTINLDIKISSSDIRANKNMKYIPKKIKKKVKRNWKE